MFSNRMTGISNNNGRVTMKAWAKKQLKEAFHDKKNGNRVADQATDLERTVGNEPLAKKIGSPFDSRVRITITSYRSRLADPDGVSAKAAIDALVICGVLRNDSCKEVEEVRHKQVKVKNKGDEKTVIEIEDV